MTFLKVFLVASESFRVAETMELLGLSEAEARKRLKQIDPNRAAYIKQVYGHDWRQLGHYDTVLETGRLGRTCERPGRYWRWLLGNLENRLILDSRKLGVDRCGEAGRAANPPLWLRTGVCACGQNRQRTSTRNLIPVLSCPATVNSMKVGMHTRAKPEGAT
jgi:hypothetical protein